MTYFNATANATFKAPPMPHAYFWTSTCICHEHVLTDPLQSQAKLRNRNMTLEVANGIEAWTNRVVSSNWLSSVVVKESDL